MHHLALPQLSNSYINSAETCANVLYMYVFSAFNQTVKKEQNSSHRQAELYSCTTLPVQTSSVWLDRLSVTVRHSSQEVLS